MFVVLPVKYLQTGQFQDRAINMDKIEEISQNDDGTCSLWWEDEDKYTVNADLEALVDFLVSGWVRLSAWKKIVHDRDI
jgi:hypothetical protein